MEALSAVVITFNEEDNIRECLESLSVADEIIIVDSNSSDNTVQIAREYTDKIFVVEWRGYACAKNYGIECAANNWILSLDADERLSDDLSKTIKDLKPFRTNITGYNISRRTWYLTRWIQGGGWYPDRNIRLFNRQFGQFSKVPVHESVVITGETQDIDGDILHYSYKNVRDHILRVEKYSSLSALQWLKNGRKPSIFMMFFRPVWEFFRKLILLGGFKDGREGIILAAIHSFYVFLKYVKLYELHLARDVTGKEMF
ncbi:glycosyltransferase family 2 protein [bacterium]|nr:glycosyltransferase family 2 protein [bacterium]